jgi:hypothetical protein
MELFWFPKPKKKFAESTMAPEEFKKRPGYFANEEFW